MKLSIRPLLAADVGMSLAIVQAAAQQHMTIPLIAFDLGVAHAVYGRDRLNDQLSAGVSDPLIEVAQVTTSLSWLFCVYFLSAHQHNEAVPLLSLLTTSYTRIKPQLGVCKPLFIGASWAYAITALPSSSFDWGTLTYYAAVFAASSSVLDIKDTEQDAKDGVSTIPVVYGPASTYALSAIVAATALSYHGLHGLVDVAVAFFALWCSAQTVVEVP